MFDEKTLRAIGRLLAREAREIAPKSGANEVIDLVPLLKAWAEGKHEAGEVVVYNDYPYKVTQTHDSTGNSLWNPVDAPTLFSPYHALDAAHALRWIAPTGEHDSYQAGEYMIWTDGKVYRCKVNATVWEPNFVPNAWEMIA